MRATDLIKADTLLHVHRSRARTRRVERIGGDGWTHRVSHGSNANGRSTADARTISEPRGFMKMLIDEWSDRILGFTVFGAGASELMAIVQTAMLGRLPYTVLRDALFTHPTAADGHRS